MMAGQTQQQSIGHGDLNDYKLCFPLSAPPTLMLESSRRGESRVPITPSLLGVRGFHCFEKTKKQHRSKQHRKKGKTRDMSISAVSLGAPDARG